MSQETYNHRFDSEAQAAGGISFESKANGKKTGSASFVSAVGQLKYGYCQTEGLAITYELYYKKSTTKEYTRTKNLIVIVRNNDYCGDWDIKCVLISTKYDLKCEKMHQNDDEL